MDLDSKIFPEKNERPYCAGFYLSRPDIKIKSHFGDIEEVFKYALCPNHLRQFYNLIREHYPEYRKFMNKERIE